MDFPSAHDSRAHTPETSSDNTLHQPATGELVVDAKAPQGASQPTAARHPVSVRLSYAERAAVAVAASSRGQSPSAFVRRAALSAAGRPLPPTLARRDALAVETAHAVGQLGRIGNLANQLARAGNAGRLNGKDIEYAFTRLTRELSRLREEIVGRDEERRLA